MMDPANPVVTPKMMANALDVAWDEFVSDTGSIPDAFERRGRKWFVDFHKGPFATYAAHRLNALIDGGDDSDA